MGMHRALCSWKLHNLITGRAINHVHGNEHPSVLYRACMMNRWATGSSIRHVRGAHDQEGTLLRAVRWPGDHRPVSGPMGLRQHGLAFNNTWTVLSVYRSTIRVVRRYASVSQASMSRSAGKEGLLFFGLEFIITVAMKETDELGSSEQRPAC